MGGALFTFRPQKESKSLGGNSMLGGNYWALNWKAFWQSLENKRAKRLRLGGGIKPTFMILFLQIPAAGWCSGYIMPPAEGCLIVILEWSQGTGFCYIMPTVWPWYNFIESWCPFQREIIPQSVMGRDELNPITNVRHLGTCRSHSRCSANVNWMEEAGAFLYFVPLVVVL